MPGAHAKLSPSASKQWLHCPGSVALSADVADTGSAASDKGTAGHALFEKCLRLGKSAKFYLGDSIDGIKVDADMVTWVSEALEWVQEYIEQAGEHAMCSEQKVNIGAYFGITGDPLWGTTDLHIITSRELVVADLKLGYVDVEVEDNTQLELYALGWLHSYTLYDFETVRLVILQPRSGGPKELVLPVDQLKAKAETFYRPRILAALAPDAPLVPGEGQCRWCKAAPVCPKLHEQTLALAKQEFAALDPRTLSVEQLVLLLDKAELIRNALTAVESHALRIAKAGVPLPGFKVVAGKKHRQWKNEAAAFVELRKLMDGDEDAIAPRALLTPAQAEKLVGKDVVAKLAEKPEGPPTLVRETDKRPALPPEFVPVADEELLE